MSIGELERSFCDALARDPGDDPARRAYAGWLEESGRRGHAELVRAATWTNCGLERLRGQQVMAVAVCDADALELKTGGGVIGVLAEGDCCSESWFYSIDGVANLLGGPVVGFVDITPDWVDPEDGLGRQDYDRVYCVGIVTTAGLCRVVYRNSSNGYYGGNLRTTATLGESMTAPPLASDWVVTQEVPK